MQSCLQKCNKLNKSHLVGQLLNMIDMLVLCILTAHVMFHNCHYVGVEFRRNVDTHALFHLCEVLRLLACVYTFQ